MMRLDIEVEPQAATCLCWAAVGVALIRYYRSGTQIDQAGLVTRLLGRFDPRPYSPTAMLTELALLRRVADHPIGLEDLRVELVAGRVVVVQFDCDIGFKHLALISGIDDAEGLWLQDPRTGPAPIAYGELVASADGWLRWTKTFLTGPDLPASIDAANRR